MTFDAFVAAAVVRLRAFTRLDRDARLRYSTELIADRARHGQTDNPRSPRAAALLVEVLDERLGTLLREIEQQPLLPVANAVDGNDLMALDAVLVTHLRSIGPTGAEIASEVVEKSADAWRSANGPVSRKDARVWRLWTSDPPNATRLLAAALWSDVVEPKTAGIAISVPSLSLPVARQLVDLHGRDNEVREREGAFEIIHPNGSALGSFRVGEPGVPAIDAGLLPRLLKSLSTIDAHRVVRWEITEAHRRQVSGEADFRRLAVAGGWSALAAAVGSGASHRDRVREVVQAQAHGWFRWPDGSHGNMLTYSYHENTRSSRAVVALVLGDMLLPGYLYRFKSSVTSHREARRLVPIVALPPRIGRDNEYAVEANFQLQLMAEFRQRVREFLDGGVKLTDADVARLARGAGISEAGASRALDGWTHDGDDAAAFLVREGDRYTLAAAHREAQQFLLDAAGLSLRKGRPQRRR